MVDPVRRQHQQFVDEAIKYQNKLLELTPMLEEIVWLSDCYKGAQNRIKKLQEELEKATLQVSAASIEQQSSQELFRVSELLEKQSLKANVPAKLHFTEEPGLVPLVAHSVLEFNLRFNKFKESIAQFKAIGLNLNAGHFARSGDAWIRGAKDNPYWLVPLCNVLALSDAVYRKYTDKMRILEYVSAGCAEPSFIIDEWLNEVALMDTDAGFESWRSSRSRLLLSTFAIADVTENAINIHSVRDGSFSELIAQAPLFRFDAALAIESEGSKLPTAYSCNPFNLKMLSRLPFCENGHIEGQEIILSTNSSTLDEYYNREDTHVLRS